MAGPSFWGNLFRSNDSYSNRVTVDDVYNAVVVQGQPTVSLNREEPFAQRMRDDVFFPMLTETADPKHGDLSWGKRFPAISKAVRGAGKIFDGLTGLLDLGKAIFKEQDMGISTGEEVVVSAGKSVAKIATTGVIIGGAQALFAGIFPVIVPPIVTLAAAGAGFYFLPKLAADVTENLIRGAGYASGATGERGRESLDWIKGTVNQIENKLESAAQGLGDFRAMIDRRKGR
jgi:hypothetical protein